MERNMKKLEYQRPMARAVTLYVEHFIADSNDSIGTGDDNVDKDDQESRKKTWNSKLWEN